MGITEAILLGLTQGATEFLPVSSSAHLVVVQALLDVSAPGIGLEISLHFGTLLAILIVLRRELARLARDGVRGFRLAVSGAATADVRQQAPMFATAVALLIGTVPIAVTGVLLEQTVARLFEEEMLTVCGLLLVATGLVLLVSRFAPKPRTGIVRPATGFLVGVAQCFALAPGISRSGITIAAGYFAGIERDAAARFSFLLAVPALAGAGVWKARRIVTGTGVPDSLAAGPGLLALVVGTAMAAAAGTLCLMLLMRVIRRGRLHWFAAYCIPTGILIVLVNPL
jgi:undecaprenyl-diphosphatase